MIVFGLSAGASVLQYFQYSSTHHCGLWIGGQPRDEPMNNCVEQAKQDS